MRAESGLIKIGYTGGDDPAHRLAAMQCLVSEEHRPVQLVSAIRMARWAALRAEREAHDRLLHERVFWGPCGDEWFRVTSQRAGCVVRAAANEIHKYGPTDIWAKAKTIWESRKLKTWKATEAPLKLLGLTPREAWRKFGART